MAVPLVLLMVVLTGCQAVGGVDVGKAMANGASIKSGESRQSMNIKIEPATELATEKDLEMIELINSISLDIDQAKMKDAKTASIKGTFSMEGTKLPFHLSMNESQLVIDLDGAQKPLYISLDTFQDAQALPMVDMKALEKQLEEISPKLFSFVLKHLSNPKNISVTPVQESVNGEALSLSKLHLEVSGEEMLAMVKPFLTSISKDEQGLKELIGDLYDVFYPVLEAVNEVEGGGDETLNSIVPESKDEAVASLYAMIKVGLDSMLVNYDQELNNLLNEDPDLKTLFGTETKLKLDFYLDSKLDIRKQNFELKVAIPASDELPLKSVTVSGDSEQWNIGGTVAVDEVDVSGGVMDLMKDDITPGQMLRNFDSNSLAYQLLKDEAGITSKSVVLFPDDEYAGAITVKNTTFVPLRYVSEELDAEVKWTKGSNQIVVIDDITGDEIVLTVGSKKATVAGKEVTMVESAYVGKDGKTYVPLRFVAESLGATVDKEQETGWIYIDRP
ncbi:copper amine oxidase N-terminal domain-containing protein [Paenibacillus amylolyticus]|uniref:copper amine oxidase N-terminal domain-containing protein n=1 Tax=Paenibacillus amylolyticus TaxID=1451 RepID=UPI0007A06BA3|nr:copper amine oxidase N-terminal domain-containing protein [Paenibacillus amylolyticus]